MAVPDGTHRAARRARMRRRGRRPQGREATWPDTRIQRCLFHVQANILELTGRRPRLEAGRQLRRVALSLPRVGDAGGAAEWLVSYNRWEQDFASFLDEKSEYADGSVNDMHQRLVKARRMIRRRIREGQLFTFLDEGLASVGPVPPTNNLIESWNARLRDMLRRHRGLRLVRRLKAICWWCHQHTAHPETDAWLAANAMPDERLERLYRQAWERSPQGQYETFGIPARYGTGIDWNEFHTRRMAVERLDRRTHILAYNPQSSSRYVSNRRNRNRHCILNRNMSTGIALAAPDPAAPEYHTS